MNIISIDFSTVNCGWAIKTGALTQSGHIKPLYSKNHSLYDRVEYIAEELAKLLPVSGDHIIVVEDVYVNHNPQTAIHLARGLGYVLGICGLKISNVTFLRASEWRKLVFGNTKKMDRKQWKAKAISEVKHLYGIEVEDDEAEALLILRAMEVYNGDKRFI